MNIFDALLLYYGAWDAQTQSRIGSQDVHREDDLKIKSCAREAANAKIAVGCRAQALAFIPRTAATYIFFPAIFLSSIFMENLFQ